MQRYSEVLGLPVICIEGGKKIGTVGDILFYPAERKVAAFLLERKGYQLGKSVILLENVVNLGRDALIVNDSQCAASYQKYKKAEAFKNNGNIKGLRVYSKSGEDVGIVKDILFDDVTGLVEGVEVSDGVLYDVLEGRKILPLFGKVEFAQENLLVEKEAVEEMMSTGGGLKNLIDK